MDAAVTNTHLEPKNALQLDKSVTTAVDPTTLKKCAESRKEITGDQIRIRMTGEEIKTNQDGTVQGTRQKPTTT